MQPKLRAWGEQVALQSLFISVPGRFIVPINLDATSKVLDLAGVSLCASVRGDMSVAPLLLAHPHFFCAHCMTLFPSAIKQCLKAAWFSKANLIGGDICQ